MKFGLARILGIVLAGVGFVLLVWSVMPISTTTVAIPINIEGALAKGLPAEIRFTWHPSVRLGESVEVSLLLPAAAGANLPATAQAQAILDLNGAEIRPGFDLRQTVTPGREVNFTWQVAALQPGDLTGQVWLFWTVSVDGKEERVPVLARPVSLHVEAFLGLPVWVARLIAAGGLIGGAGLVWLNPRRGKKKTKKM